MSEQGRTLMAEWVDLAECVHHAVDGGAGGCEAVCHFTQADLAIEPAEKVATY